MAELNIFARHEIKYLIDYDQRKFVESVIAQHMNPDPHGQSTICNIYFDTPDYRLIRHSLEKPIYKEELRMRSYGQVESGDKVFLELKKKYDGIVYKRRIELPERTAMAFISGKVKNSSSLWLTDKQDIQIAKELQYARDFYQDLAPRVHLSYDRCAYFAKDDPNIRLTFDRNIRWRPEDLSLTAAPGGAKLLDRGYSLMELKTSMGLPMWMVGMLNKGGMKKANFSKYGKAYESILQKELMEKNSKYLGKDYKNGYSISKHNDRNTHTTELFD